MNISSKIYSKINIKLIFLIIFLFFFVSSGCSKNKTTKYNFKDYVELSIKETIFYAQVAIKPNEINEGLMFRNKLEKNHGMIFVFPNARKVSFWMKNVSFPLDAGYFDKSGQLIEIHNLFPHDQSPVKSKNSNIKYVLEMNKGWFSNNGISLGDRLDFKELEEKINLRKIN